MLRNYYKKRRNNYIARKFQKRNRSRYTTSINRGLKKTVPKGVARLIKTFTGIRKYPINYKKVRTYNTRNNRIREKVRTSYTRNKYLQKKAIENYKKLQKKKAPRRAKTTKWDMLKKSRRNKKGISTPRYGRKDYKALLAGKFGKKYKHRRDKFASLPQFYNVSNTFQAKLARRRYLNRMYI